MFMISDSRQEDRQLFLNCVLNTGNTDHLRWTVVPVNKGTKGENVTQNTSAICLCIFWWLVYSEYAENQHQHPHLCHHCCLLYLQLSPVCRWVSPQDASASAWKYRATVAYCCQPGPNSILGVSRYGWVTIRYVSRYGGHDTIRITIHYDMLKQSQQIIVFCPSALHNLWPLHFQVYSYKVHYKWLLKYKGKCKSSGLKQAQNMLCP